MNSLNGHFKKAFLLPAYLFFAFSSAAQLKIGGESAAIRGDAALELGTTRKGLLLPRVGNAALSAPPLDTAANGMLLFNTGTNSLMVKNGSGAAGWKQVADASALDYLWTMAGNANADDTHFLGTAGTQPLIFKTNLSEAMRIDPAGNIGIGTSYPSSRLHVNGSLATNLVIATTDFSVADSNSVIIMNNAADATLTLQSAAANRGRALEIVSYNLGKIIYAGADVKTQAGAGQTVLLPGYTVRIVSDGTDWVVTSRQRNGLPMYLATAPGTGEGEAPRDYDAFVDKGSGLFLTDGITNPANPIPGETAAFSATWQGTGAASFAQLNVNAGKAYFRSGAASSVAASVWNRFLSIPAASLFSIADDGADNIVFRHTGNNSISFSTGNTVRATITEAGETRLNHAFSLPIAVAGTSPYTATVDDYTIIVTPSGGTGNFVVTLPAASACKGRIYMVKRFDGAFARPVEVGPASGDRIENGVAGASFMLDDENLRCYTFQSDGTDRWYVINIQ